MIEQTAVEAKLQALKAQREQAVATIHMIDGAVQVLETLLAEAKQMVQAAATAEKQGQ